VPAWAKALTLVAATGSPDHTAPQATFTEAVRTGDPATPVASWVPDPLRLRQIGPG